MPLSPNYGARARIHPSRWLRHHWRDLTLGGLILLGLYGLLNFLQR